MLFQNSSQQLCVSLPGKKNKTHKINDYDFGTIKHNHFVKGNDSLLEVSAEPPLPSKKSSRTHS